MRALRIIPLYCSIAALGPSVVIRAAVSSRPFIFGSIFLGAVAGCYAEHITGRRCGGGGSSMIRPQITNAYQIEARHVIL